MNIEIVSENAYARRALITFPAVEVTSALEGAFRTYEKRMRMPGFRQGRVPRQLIEAQYGPSIRAEVADNLLQRGWTAALTEHAIVPVSQPRVVEGGEIARNQDFTVAIGYEVKPEITAQNYTGLEVYWPKSEVEPAEIDAELERRRQREARLATVEGRAIEAGDTVQASLKASEGQESLIEEPGTIVRTAGETWFKGLEGALIGMNVGENRTAEVTFAEDARNTAIAGKTLSVEISVLSIQALTAPELTDAFAQELEFTDLAAMREAITADLAKSREGFARSQAQANAITALIERNPVDVPSGMVDQNLDLLKQELRYQAALQGQDPKNVTFSDEQLLDLRQRALFATRGSLLVASVGQLESIAIADDALDTRIAEMAQERSVPPETVRGWLERDGGVEELRERMLEEAILNWLLDHATISHDAPEASAAAAAPAASKPAKASKSKAAAPAPAAPAAADLSILEGAIGDLKNALATGAYDAQLDALIEAESAGRARKGALTALAARKSALG